MLQKQNLSEEFKDYEFGQNKFKSIRNKFEKTQNIPTSSLVLMNSLKRNENVNSSFENLNNSIEESTSSSASSAESGQTAYEVECDPNSTEYRTSNNMFYMKSNSVSNIFSIKDADFLKFSLSCRNPTLSKSLAKSNGDNLDEISFRDTGYKMQMNKNEITKSNDENLSYLEPNNKENELLRDIEPFPFPTSFVKSRTDLFNEDDKFDNVPVPDEHLFANHIEDSIVVS